VGEFAIAIGAPFALDYSVTFGHVSAKGRSDFSLAADLWNQDFIQTDASINPGNSGGPLVNLDGEVIGINTLIRGMNTGIGFAVPSSLAKRVSDQLIAHQKFTRSYLGIATKVVAEGRDSRNGDPSADKGLTVTLIQRDGPAAKSDLELGDVIVAVDGVPIATLQELRNEVGAKPVGSNVSLDVLRDGKKLKVKIMTGELPEDLLAANRSAPRRSTPAEPKVTSFGLSVQTLTPQLAKKFDVDMVEGVVVTEVGAGSAAETAGIKPGEVITRIGRTPVKSVKAFQEAMKNADPKQGVPLSIVGGDGRRLLTLKNDGD
jgi:serine protease Do